MNTTSETEREDGVKLRNAKVGMLLVSSALIVVAIADSGLDGTMLPATGSKYRMFGVVIGAIAAFEFLVSFRMSSLGEKLLSLGCVAGGAGMVIVGHLDAPGGSGPVVLAAPFIIGLVLGLLGLTRSR